MTPHQIIILLECHYCMTPGVNVMPHIWNSPMAIQTRQEFCEAGIIDPETFIATGKGNEIVSRLCGISSAEGEA